MAPPHTVARPSLDGGIRLKSGEETESREEEKPHIKYDRRRSKPFPVSDHSAGLGQKDEESDEHEVVERSRNLEELATLPDRIGSGSKEL